MDEYPLQVWVPGPPGLREGPEAVADYAELVQAWCREERLPPGSAVKITIHFPDGWAAPKLDRLSAVIEAAADAEVIEAVVVRDGRCGVLIQRVGESRRRRPVQLALFEAREEMT